MQSEFIEIIGAKQNNLKNISLKIPKNKFIVITGLSGSGKSSLAFDTIYAEGQRRYIESLSTYARQFLNVQNKPDVESGATKWDVKNWEKKQAQLVARFNELDIELAKYDVYHKTPDKGVQAKKKEERMLAKAHKQAAKRQKAMAIA